MKIGDISRQNAIDLLVSVLPDISLTYLNIFLNDVAEETSIDGIVNILLTNGYESLNREVSLTPPPPLLPTVIPPVPPPEVIEPDEPPRNPSPVEAAREPEYVEAEDSSDVEEAAREPEYVEAEDSSDVEEDSPDMHQRTRISSEESMDMSNDELLLADPIPNQISEQSLLQSRVQLPTVSLESFDIDSSLSNYEGDESNSSNNSIAYRSINFTPPDSEQGSAFIPLKTQSNMPSKCHSSLLVSRSGETVGPSSLNLSNNPSNPSSSGNSMPQSDSLFPLKVKSNMTSTSHSNVSGPSSLDSLNNHISVSSSNPIIPTTSQSNAPSTSHASNVASSSLSSSVNQGTSVMCCQSSPIMNAPIISLSDFPSKNNSKIQICFNIYDERYRRSDLIKSSGSILKKVKLIDQHQNIYRNITEMFPKIDPNYLTYKIVKFSTKSADEMLEMFLINRFLEKGFTKIQMKPIVSTRTSSSNKEENLKEILGYFTLKTPPLYTTTKLVAYMKYAFSGIYANCLTVIVQRSIVRRFAPIYFSIMKFFKENKMDPLKTHYDAANRAVRFQVNHEGKMFLLRFKTSRTKYAEPSAQQDPELFKEYMYCTTNIEAILESEDIGQVAKAIVSKEESKKVEDIIGGFAPEDLIECGCCFGEAAFQMMAQCSDGHLVCKICINGYAKEAAFGQGRAALECIDSECSETYPQSQLLRILDKEILQKLEERRSYDALIGIEDLVHCPRCNFACELPPENKVMNCLSCNFQSCRYCKEDWDRHMGKKCEELKTSDSIRREYEEKMAMVSIRECPSCKSKIVKVDGCNKITCRCGGFMCYICRNKIKDYDHFCQHPLSPGKGCQKCTKCKLHTNTKEDETRNLEQLKKEAIQMKRTQGLDETEVGPSSPKKKKN